jgi:hypothetical protein
VGWLHNHYGNDRKPDVKKHICIGIATSRFTYDIKVDVLLTKYYSDNQIKNTERGMACSTQGARRDVYTILAENLRKENYLEDPGVDGRLMLKWILEKCDWGSGLDQSGSGQGHVAISCECGNELSGSIKCEEFLE